MIKTYKKFHGFKRFPQQFVVTIKIIYSGTQETMFIVQSHSQFRYHVEHFTLYISIKCFWMWYEKVYSWNKYNLI